MILEGVLRMPPDCWSGDVIDVAQRHSIYCEAADLIDKLRSELTFLRGELDIADIQDVEEFRQMAKNAERYRKLRELKCPVQYAVTEISKCECGSQVVMWDDLDSVIDAMEAADGQSQ